MRWKSIIWTILGLAVLLGIIWMINFFWLRPVNIEHFYERIAYDQAELNSEFFVHLPESNRDHFNPFRVQYHERTPSFYQNRANLSREHLSDLKSYPTKYLSEAELISYQSISHFLTQQVEAASFVDQLHVLESFQPTSDPIFFLLYQQPIHSVEQAKTYTTRMRNIDKSYGEIISGLKSSEEKGIIPPKLLIETKIKELNILLNTPPSEHPLYVEYARKIVRISHMEIKEFEQVGYLTTVEELIEEEVNPACQRYIDYLQSLLPKAEDNFSANFLGESQAFYRHILNGYLGQGFSPEELHQKGREYIAGIQQKLSEANELVERDMTPLNSALTDSLTSIYIDSLLLKIEETGFKWAGILGTDMPIKPEVGVLSSIYSYLDAFYLSSDFNPKSKAKLSMSSAILSEGDLSDVFAYTIPGLHYQRNILTRNEDLAYFTRLIDEQALQHGWILYSRQLAEEYGFLSEMPNYESDLLYQQRLYAGLMVVETGLLSQGWSIEQAETYFMESLGLSVKEAQACMIQIFTQPGLFSSYWIGYQRIVEMREKAKDLKGMNFNIANFHQWLLLHQTIPLDDIGAFFEDYANSPAL